MKKQIIIISVLVIIVSVFISCSANSSSGDISTTAVTDSNGIMHYYEVITDDTETTVLKEIETLVDRKAVTEKNGKYATKEYTVILTTAKSKVSSSLNTTKNMEAADNIVDFEPDDTTKPTVTTTVEKEASKTTTQKEIPPATDKDGWITKWY